MRSAKVGVEHHAEEVDGRVSAARLGAESAGLMVVITAGGLLVWTSYHVIIPTAHVCLLGRDVVMRRRNAGKRKPPRARRLVRDNVSKTSPFWSKAAKEENVIA